MKRLANAGGAIATGVVPSDTWLIENCPLLLDYLTNVKYDDGTERTPSTLNLFIQDGVFKTAVNDRDAEASLYSSGSTLQDALVATEKRLNTSQSDWRFWPKRNKKK